MFTKKHERNQTGAKYAILHTTKRQKGIIPATGKLINNLQFASSTIAKNAILVAYKIGHYDGFSCFNPKGLGMSCFQLSDRHHASIAHYVAECNMWPDSKIQEFADKLKRCNIASVNYRYDRQTPARKCKIDCFQQLDAKSYFDAIRCWAYQSCDNPHNLEFDILRAFLFSLAHPGYSTDIPVDQWGIV